jgi:hypothetical protein
MEKNLLTVKRKICLPQVEKICLPRKEKTVYLTGKILLDIQKGRDILLGQHLSKALSLSPALFGQSVVRIIRIPVSYDQKFHVVCS